MPDDFLEVPWGYRDPAGYLNQPDFHLELIFTPSFLSEPSTVSYAIAGSKEPDAVNLFWIGGMGGHRLIVYVLDEVCKQRNVRLLMLDRPGCGHSSFVPIEQRFRWSFEAFLAVLDKYSITSLHLITHSNGVLYSLYTLLQLTSATTTNETDAAQRKLPRVESWAMTAPWVPTWHSGHKTLTAARYIPGIATSQLGHLVTIVNGALGTFAWSSAVANDAGRSFATRLRALGSASTTTGSRGASSTTTTATTSQDDETKLSEKEEDKLARAEREWKRFAERNAKRKPEKRTVAGYHRSEDCMDLMFDKATSEGKTGIGQEALVCLAIPDARSWGWGVPEGHVGKVDESALYENGFGQLKKQVDAHVAGQGQGLKISVWYGKEDGFVPAKGRDYLRVLLVDKLKLVDREEWHDIEYAGHDDVVNLECVIHPIVDAIAITKKRT